METSRKLVQALSLLSLVVVAPVAQAADGQALDRVEVQAAPVLRTDVQRSCPRAAEQLQQGLEAAVTRHMVEGSFPVYFELRGNQVVSTRAMRAPTNFRPALSRVVKSLDCLDQASQQQPQRFGFILDISLDEVDRGTRTAGVTLRPLVGSDLR